MMLRSDSRQTLRVVLVSLVTLLLGGGVGVAEEEVPKHPSELVYGDLDFSIPRAEPLRHELDGGAVAYVVEDRALPLASISVFLRAGAFQEPADKVGLAAITGRLLRTGGTVSLTPEDFDDAIDFLAARVSVSMGETETRANLSCLSDVIDECLDHFFEMLSEPRFDADKLEIEKNNILESLKQRNDDAQSMASREWQWLLYGQDHFSSRLATSASLDAITRDDLMAFHRRHVGPRGAVFAVSGDVETDTIVAELERRLADWDSEAVAPAWPPEKPDHEPVPGIYLVDKDIPQGRVRIGHLLPQRESWEAKDELALDLMNSILGGSGFTSRITSRVRSDEGLAYSAGSFGYFGDHWDGEFDVVYQSKSETVIYAAKIALEEVDRIRSELVSTQELETAKAFLADTLPAQFESSSQVASLFARDEMLGRPHDYWYDYQERVSALTKEDVRRVAEKYLDPDKLVMLVVGDRDAVVAGDPDGRATLDEVLGGRTTDLPARDPLTLEVISK